MIVDRVNNQDTLEVQLEVEESLSSCSRGDRPLVDLYVELAGFSNDAPL